MLKHIKDIKDNKIKIEFSFSVISLSELPQSSAGNAFSVEFKGGKLSNSFPTPKVVATSEGSAKWKTEDAHARITTRFHQDSTTKGTVHSNKKEVIITIKEDKDVAIKSKASLPNLFKSKKDTPTKDSPTKKEATVFAKCALNLSNYADKESVNDEVITIKSMNNHNFKLHLKIESRWIKIGRKKIVREVSNRGTTGGDVNEDNYVLQTADDASETGTTMSERDAEEEEEESIELSGEYEAGSGNTTQQHRETTNSREMLSTATSDVRSLSDTNNLPLPNLVYKLRDAEKVIEEDVRNHTEDQYSYKAMLTRTPEIYRHKFVTRKRTMSDTIIPFSEGHVVHIPLDAQRFNPTEKLKLQFETELANLRQRNEQEFAALKKDKDRSVRKAVEERKKIEDTLKQAKDEKVKLENSVNELSSHLEIEMKEKKELQEQVDTFLKKESKTKSKTRDSTEEVKLQQAVQLLNKELYEVRGSYKYLQERYQALDHELTTLKLKDIKSTQTIEDNEKVIKEMKHQYHLLQEKFRETSEASEEAIGSYRSQIESLEKQIQSLDRPSNSDTILTKRNVSSNTPQESSNKEISKKVESNSGMSNERIKLYSVFLFFIIIVLLLLNSLMKSC